MGPPSQGRLVPDFPFPTHLLSVIYFCLDSQSGWVKMVLISVCFPPTRHTAAAEPQLPVFFHTAVPLCGLSRALWLQPHRSQAPAARAARNQRFPGLPRPLPSITLPFLEFSLSETLRRGSPVSEQACTESGTQCWSQAPPGPPACGGLEAAPCNRLVLNTIGFQEWTRRGCSLFFLTKFFAFTKYMSNHDNIDTPTPPAEAPEGH